MGPKIENVGFSFVLPLLFEGSRLPRGRRSREQLSEPDRFEVQKVVLLIKKALWLYSELCFLLQRGAQFHKNHENKLLEGETWSQNNVGYIKIPPKWCWKHEDVIKIMSDTPLKSPKEGTCSNNTHICDDF